MLRGAGHLNELPEGREAQVIKNVIRTKNQFIEYVAFILGDDYVQSFLENKKSCGTFSEWNHNTEMPAVYEKMLNDYNYNMVARMNGTWKKFDELMQKDVLDNTDIEVLNKMFIQVLL